MRTVSLCILLSVVSIVNNPATSPPTRSVYSSIKENKTNPEQLNCKNKEAKRTSHYVTACIKFQLASIICIPKRTLQYRQPSVYSGGLLFSLLFKEFFTCPLRWTAYVLTYEFDNRINNIHCMLCLCASISSTLTQRQENSL